MSKRSAATGVGAEGRSPHGGSRAKRSRSFLKARREVNGSRELRAAAGRLSQSDATTFSSPRFNS